MRPLYVGIVVGLFGVLLVAGASSGFTAVYSDRAVSAQTVADGQGYLAMVGEEKSIDPSVLDHEEVPGLEEVNETTDGEGGGQSTPLVCELEVTNDFGEEVDVTIRHGGAVVTSATLEAGENATFTTAAGERFTVEADGEHVEFDAERRIDLGCDVAPRFQGGDDP